MASVASSVVLMSETLLKLPATVSLCREARSIIIQNMALAIFTKVVAATLAISGKDHEHLMNYPVV